MSQKKYHTFITKYGDISIYKNEAYIIQPFLRGEYWDEKTLLELKKIIDPNRNILEIGAHCGTSSIVYASFLNDDKKVFAFEPQKKQFELLKTNIANNNLNHKIVPFHKALFCYNGIGYMNDIDFDCTKANVNSRYENNLPCNFGGISVGKKGEQIKFVELDYLSKYLPEIGFVHMDAQGSENFIFSKGKEFFRKHRPIVYFENNALYDKQLYDLVCYNYPEYEEESKFEVEQFFMEELGYKNYIKQFSHNDDLIIP